MEHFQDNVWNTSKVTELMKMIDDGYIIKNSPFWENKPEWRSGNLVFEYTDEEIAEIKRCASDIIYFANSYCYAMTDDGVQNIKLRDYQEDVLRDFQDNDMCVFLSCRQIGKTICSGIFLVWYLLFNYDKNILILANIGDTTREIIEKVKVILSHLPFFLKPGIIKNDQMTMKFDNGCRVFGKNTTKTAALGFNIHLLFLDEAAHIHANFIEPFWRSVYPTLSASKNGRIVMTSTPNGLNKFCEIYQAAVEGRNEFYPIRVDWWQVPGRDEAWKAKEIANLGSEEDFNQEYGNQFLSSSKLLLDGPTLAGIKKVQTEFKWVEIADLNDTTVDYEHLRWHPKFDLDNIIDTDRFVFSIDTANGTGGDYSIINIFKIIPTPVAMIEKKLHYTDESDFFSLMQVGIFRNNRQPIEDLLVITETLLYKVFNEESVKIVLEMDFKGNLLYEKMSMHENFYDDIFIHTKHTQDAVRLKPGVKLNQKNKTEYCMLMKKSIKSGRIIPYEKHTFNELSAFGLNKKGSYSSQTGHDDISMTIVNLTSFFDSPQFYEIVESVYDNLDDKYKTAIEKKLNTDESGTGGGIDFSALKDLF